MRKLILLFDRINPKIFPIIIFITTCLIFSLLIKYGGFHHSDDFHFFRKYRWNELIKVWYSNWDLDGTESDGYRPLAIWIYSLFYIIFGFSRSQPVFYMTTIVLLNGIYSLFTFRLARHFLSKNFAFLVALFSVISPKTLFHFTWATEIPATICFILVLAGFEKLLYWTKKPQNTRLFIEIVMIGIIASLIKEAGYSVLASIPIVAFLLNKNIVNKKYSKFRLTLLKLLPILLPSILLLFLLFMRQLSLQVFPELIDPTSPQIEFKLNFSIFKNMSQNFLIIIKNFYSVSIQIILYFIPRNIKELNIFIWSDSLIFSSLSLISAFIINNFFWKKRFFSHIIFLHFVSILLYLLLTKIFLFSLIFRLISGSNLLLLGFTAYKYFTFITLLFISYYLIKNLKKKYFYLIIFFLVSTVPLLFFQFNRLRPVPHTVLLILTFCTIELFFFSRYKTLKNIGVALTVISVYFLILFVINTFKFIIIENYRISFKIKTKLINEKFRPSLAKDIFTKQSTSIIGPDDCSKAWPGNPDFELYKGNKENKKVLILSSRNHIACISVPVNNFHPKKNYQLSFYAKTIIGDNQPDIYFRNVFEPATRITLSSTDNGWQLFDVSFIPLEPTLYIGLYSKGINGKLNSIAYKDFYFKGGSLFTYLHNDFTWPKLFNSDALKVPFD